MNTLFGSNSNKCLIDEDDEVNTGNIDIILKSDIDDPASDEE